MNQEEVGAEDAPNWRARFISLAEDVCRERGQPAAVIVDDPDDYLSMKIPVEGLDFECLHFPDAQARMIVHCRLGPVLEPREAAMQKNALSINLALALKQAGMFTRDPSTGDLTYCTAESLHELTATQLLENMSAMVASLQPWTQPSRQSA